MMISPTTKQATDRVLAALNTLKWQPTDSEFDVQDAVAKKLSEANVDFQREVVIGPHCRVDFVINVSSQIIALEVKRGKQAPNRVVAQIERYAACPNVVAIILVLDRGLIRIPTSIGETPVTTVTLTKNWGIAT